MIMPKTITTEMSRHVYSVTAFFAGAQVDQLVELAFEQQPNLREAYDALKMTDYMFDLLIFDKPESLVRVHCMLGIFRSAMKLLQENPDDFDDAHVNACISVYEHLQSEEPRLFEVFDFSWVKDIDVDLYRDEFDAGVLTLEHRNHVKALYLLILELAIQFIDDYEEDYQLTLPQINPTSLN